MTDDSQRDDSDLQPALGVRLKTIRGERGLTLASVARETGISRSFLSLVESGSNEISISRLVRLLRAYDVHIGDVLDDIADDDYDLIRHSERRSVLGKGERVGVYALSHDAGRSMAPMVVEFEPGEGVFDYGRHPGEEFIHVLDGAVELNVTPATEWTELQAGDTVWFSGRRGHRVRNSSDDPARILTVISPNH